MRKLQGERKIKVIFQAVITLIMFIGIFFLMKYIIQNPLPEGNKEIVYTLTGAYLGYASMIMNFWFNNHLSSSDRDKLNSKTNEIDK